MNTRAYEGFKNGSINTVKDIINRNDFGLSKSNEDNLNDFRSSQSLYNNENISIQPIKEDNTFKIHINNKCLEVKGDKNYSLKECNKVTPTQYFEAIKIRNKPEAIEINKVIPSNENTHFIKWFLVLAAIVYLWMTMVFQLFLVIQILFNNIGK